MKKALWAVLLLCCGLAQGQKSGPFNLNTQGTSGSASCAVISLNPATSSTVVINVSGTFSLTLQPAVQVQGQAVANVLVTPSTSTTAQSTITAAGAYYANVGPVNNFQVCVSAYTSGTAVVYLNAGSGVNASILGGGGGGGGGGVTSFNTRTGDVVPALADYEALLLTSATLDADFNVTDADGNFISGTSTGIDIGGAHGGGFNTDVNGQLNIFGQTGQVVSFLSTGTWNSGATTIDGTDGHITVNKSVSAGTYQTASACASAASPAVCGSAAAGFVAMPATGATPTLVVDTSAVTANSQIFVQNDESLGSALGITCNTTLATLVAPVVTARSAGVSFTITMNSTLASHPACLSFFIIN